MTCYNLNLNDKIKAKMLLKKGCQLIFAQLTYVLLFAKNTEINWPKIVVNKARYGDYVNLSPVLRYVISNIYRPKLCCLHLADSEDSSTYL